MVRTLLLLLLLTRFISCFNQLKETKTGLRPCVRVRAFLRGLKKEANPDGEQGEVVCPKSCGGGGERLKTNIELKPSQQEPFVVDQWYIACGFGFSLRVSCCPKGWFSRNPCPSTGESLEDDPRSKGCVVKVFLIFN